MFRLSLLGLLFTIACASAGSGKKPDAMASQAPARNLVCRYEAPTGSHIAERICEPPNGAASDPDEVAGSIGYFTGDAR